MGSVFFFFFGGGNVSTHTHTHTHKHTNTHSHVHIVTCRHMCMCLYACAHTHTHICMHAHTLTPKHTHTHAHTHTHTHKYTCTHIFIVNEPRCSYFKKILPKMVFSCTWSNLSQTTTRGSKALWLVWWVGCKFHLLTTASPTIQGALKDSLGEAVVAYDVPKPCEFLSLDSCHCQRFLWAHKEVDLAPHPVIEFVL